MGVRLWKVCCVVLGRNKGQMVYFKTEAAAQLFAENTFSSAPEYAGMFGVENAERLLRDSLSFSYYYNVDQFYIDR